MSKYRMATYRDVRSMDRIVTLKQDVYDIKNLFHELRNPKGDSSHTFSGIMSGPVSNRSNEPRQMPERIKSCLQPDNGS